MKKTRNRESQQMWTTKEIKYILDNHKTKTAQMMADDLGRKYSSVKNKALSLGVRCASKHMILDYVYYDGEKPVALGKLNEISEKSGISVTNLLRYRFKSEHARLKRRLVAIED